MTTSQWERLQAAFPEGVCDYERPGRGQGRVETWLSDGDPDTPVHGGRNLRARPSASGQGG